MTRDQPPVTLAVRFLRDRQIPFSTHLYDYRDHGGAAWAAEALGLPPGQVIKTLVFETDDRRPLLVLMPGTLEVSTKALARHLGVKAVAPCEPAKAQRLTGYQVGGISPFGTRQALPIYVERSIFALPRLYINGGKRGFLVGLVPADLRRALPDCHEVDVGLTHGLTD
ncbi:MAG: Transcriptional regulator [Candidatus Ozemobacter sibiricus]|uniref:Cys-tRNA(Pro)/Cys-tRNA(Cys) deacylase n=1 Tax=Candidatus Ozemobacter sibiricus TaxID=2268124 RepID=A0A367ZTA3_9BACT|nr:MAG: Transcriptional regulator [Candidatus Ozemobacter sibiricus]